MPPSSPPPIDIVTVLVAIAGAFFGEQLAAVIGPYAVIVLGAVLGGAWSASRRPPATRLGTLGYMALIVGWALMITVPAAEAAVRLGMPLEARWMLGPLAIVIGAIGADWPDVGRWFLNLIRILIERRVGGAGNTPPPGDAP